MNTEEFKILMEIKQEQGRQSATLEQILEQAKKTRGQFPSPARLELLDDGGNLIAGKLLRASVRGY